MVNIPKELKEMPLVIEKRHEPAYVNALDDNNENEEETPWYTDIFNYIDQGNIHPTPLKGRKEL